MIQEENVKMENLKAPPGKTRVIVIDLFSHFDCLVDDFPSREEAIKVADGFNSRRTSKMDSVYYVYDDQGNYIHGSDWVSP